MQRHSAHNTTQHIHSNFSIESLFWLLSAGLREKRRKILLDEMSKRFLFPSFCVGNSHLTERNACRSFTLDGTPEKSARWLSDMHAPIYFNNKLIN